MMFYANNYKLLEVNIFKSNILFIKNYLSKISFTIATIVLFSLIVDNSQVHAFYNETYNEIMRGVDEEFYKSNNRLAVVTRPMNVSYINYLRDNPEENKSIKSNALYFPSEERTHALALAVCAGDSGRVELFLMHIKDPHDPALLVQGYRQAYNMVSLAADPIWPMQIPARLDSRLRIIDRLAAAQFDFNFIPPDDLKSSGPYRNAPLATATFLHGNYEGTYKGINVNDAYQSIQARLMLYGADPKIKSSCRRLMDEDDVRYCARLAFKQVLEEKLQNLRPMDEVKKVLEEIKAEYLERISKMAF